VPHTYSLFLRHQLWCSCISTNRNFLSGSNRFVFLVLCPTQFSLVQSHSFRLVFSHTNCLTLRLSPFFLLGRLVPPSSFLLPFLLLFFFPRGCILHLRLRLDIWVGQHCSNWLTLSLLFFLRHYKVARIKYSTVTQIKEAASAGSFLLRISHVEFVSIFTLYRST
jgi:hypothetical protein